MQKKNSLPGLAQWFQMGAGDRVDATVEIINELDIQEFRILFSWAEWKMADGPDWFDYYIPKFGEETAARLVPTIFYTPPHLARRDDEGKQKTSYPPQNLGDYADFVGEMIDRYGQYFDWVQIWNEPNWTPYWDEKMDPKWELFAEMARGAAEVAHNRGKQAALGGLSPYQPEWLTRMQEHKLLQTVDAVGLHYSPSWTNQRAQWFGWDTELETAREHLHDLGLEIWIAETGYATVRGNEADYADQVKFFDKTRQADADKIFWYCAIDQMPDHQTDDVINMDTDDQQEAAFHFGLETVEGKKKPLYDHWKKLAQGNK